MSWSLDALSSRNVFIGYTNGEKYPARVKYTHHFSLNSDVDSFTTLNYPTQIENSIGNIGKERLLFP